MILWTQDGRGMSVVDGPLRQRGFITVLKKSHPMDCDLVCCSCEGLPICTKQDDLGTHWRCEGCGATLVQQ